MPTVFTKDDKHHFDRAVAKLNGFVVGIERNGDGIYKHHFPPQRVMEVEGELAYESNGHTHAPKDDR